MEKWSRRQESNLYPTLRRHVHYPLCYGEKNELLEYKMIKVGIAKKRWGEVIINAFANLPSAHRPNLIR